MKHWRTVTRSKTGLCKELVCTNDATVGALVQKSNSKDTIWYIVPLCSTHNDMKGLELDLLGNPTLVSTNVSKTCG